MKQEQRRRQKGQLNSSKGTEFELNPRQCTVQRTELTGLWSALCICCVPFDLLIPMSFCTVYSRCR